MQCGTVDRTARLRTGPRDLARRIERQVRFRLDASRTARAGGGVAMTVFTLPSWLHKHDQETRAPVSGSRCVARASRRVRIPDCGQFFEAEEYCSTRGAGAVRSRWRKIVPWIALCRLWRGATRRTPADAAHWPLVRCPGRADCRPRRFDAYGQPSAVDTSSKLNATQIPNAGWVQRCHPCVDTLGGFSSCFPSPWGCWLWRSRSTLGRDPGASCPKSG